MRKFVPHEGQRDRPTYSLASTEKIGIGAEISLTSHGDSSHWYRSLHCISA